MTKRATAKHKIDRRLGENIWGRPKSPLNKREKPPRPARRAPRRQAVATTASSCAPSRSSRATTATSASASSSKIYEEARRFKGSTSEQMIGLLERRLDAVVYRAKFVPTVFAARQFVSHGHIKVNGRRVNIPSYRCKVGDVIEVKEKSRELRAGARSRQEPRARRARLHRGRPQQDDGQVRARARPVRRAVPGRDGAEPGGRVLLALITYRSPAFERAAPERGGSFAFVARRPLQHGAGKTAKPFCFNAICRCPHLRYYDRACA